jgi:hypothetical protein
MTPIEQIAIKHACERTVLDFFSALDSRDDESVVGYMAADGIWERAGARLEGRDSVMEALAVRPKQRVTCHAVNNMRIEVRDNDHAVVRFYLIAYEGHEGETSFRIAAIRECSDTLTRIEDRWLIALKQSRAHLPLQT